MADLDYLLAAQLNDGSERILNPDEKGWADKDVLAETRVWSLVPKFSNAPMVTVAIPEKGKPVYKSRVYGKLAAPGEDGPSFRAYAIGYKLGRKTHWTWILPFGIIEVGDDPVNADLILRRIAGLS